MDIAIHGNPSQVHQVKLTELISNGFKRHGLRSTVTSDRLLHADIHVVIGPHYAKNTYLSHNNVILVDRCYYKGNPDHVSVGWMNTKGGRDFVEGEGRVRPKVRKSLGDKSLFLADFNGVVEDADIVRQHPANVSCETTLAEDIKQCDRAIGYNTTALVLAALGGLDVTCKGDTSILLDENWLNLLPYADWHNDEIESGELWHHLKLSFNQIVSQ